MEQGSEKTVAILSPSLTGGGAERAAGKLATSLQGKVAELYFFCLYPDEGNYEYSGKLIDFGFGRIRDKYIKYGRRIFHLRIALEYIMLPYRVKKEKVRLGIDITISFLDLMGIINILSKANDRVVVSVRIAHSYSGNFLKELKTKNIREAILNQLVYRYYEMADKVVAVSKAIALSMIKDYDLDIKKVVSIGNSVDAETIRKQAAEPFGNSEKKFYKEHKVIINVGRLNKQKNQARLISIFKEIKKKDCDYGLIIVGSGDEENSLKELCVNAGIMNDVRFIPYTSNPYKYVANADLFMLTSDYEGYPNVVIEAMACRVPVASVDCKTGPREILSDGKDIIFIDENGKRCKKGLLIPFDAGDDAIANAVIEMMNDKKYIEQITHNAFNYVRTVCSEEYITEKWMRIIREFA